MKLIFMKQNKLTSEEEDVIIRKKTEPPFSGEYNKLFEKGTYVCRKCNLPIFESKSKFEAGCGWPSFDDAIPGSIKRIPDSDGKCIEIVCARCAAHLGHVFEGENFTPKNTRYCANSLSLKFIPKKHNKKNHAEK